MRPVSPGPSPYSIRTFSGRTVKRRPSRSKTAIRRSVVVFPEPDGPRSVKNSPRATSRSTPATACTSAYDLRTPTRRTSAGAVAGAASGSARGSVRVAKRLLQDVEAAVELLVGHHERDEDPDHVPVQAAGQEDQPTLARGCGRRGRELRRLL